MAKVEFQRCVVVDGKAYATIQEAQKAIIRNVLGDLNAPMDLAEKILAEKDSVLAALTLTDSSRPSARKAFGATKKSRKSKPTELPGIEPKAA